MIVDSFSTDFEPQTIFSFSFNSDIHKFENVMSEVAVTEFLETMDDHISYIIQKLNMNVYDGSEFNTVDDAKDEYNILDWDHLDCVMSLKQSLSTMCRDFSDRDVYARCYYDTDNKPEFERIDLNENTFLNGIIGLGETFYLQIPNPFTTNETKTIKVGSGDLVFWPSYLRVILTTPRNRSRKSLSLKLLTSDSSIKNYFNISC